MSLGHRNYKLRKADCIPPNYQWKVGEGCFNIIQKATEQSIQAIPATVLTSRGRSPVKATVIVTRGRSKSPKAVILPTNTVEAKVLTAVARSRSKSPKAIQATVIRTLSGHINPVRAKARSKSPVSVRARVLSARGSNKKLKPLKYIV